MYQITIAKEGMSVQLQVFLTLPFDGDMSVQPHIPTALPPGKELWVFLDCGAECALESILKLW
jgi:hypothetical protein